MTSASKALTISDMLDFHGRAARFRFYLGPYNTREPGYIWVSKTFAQSEKIWPKEARVTSFL